MKWYSTVDDSELESIKKQAKTHKKRYGAIYYELACSFDIESTSTYIDGEKLAFMYIWMVSIDNKVVVYGRTWNQFNEFMNQVTRIFNTSKDKRLVFYIHNMPFEFQFMRHYVDIDEDSVFSVDARNVVKAVTKQGIEYRDSYILSGMNLEHVAMNLQSHKIRKLVGNLDYELVRTPETPLTDDELAYCSNDVLIVVDYIQEQIEQYKSIKNIPMTNTGRVRRYTKQQVLQGGKAEHRNRGNESKRYQELISVLTLDVPSYEMLKRAFQGGFTHANALVQGQVIKNVSSFDFTSSYPTVMVTEEYPISKPIPFDDDFMENWDINRKAYLSVFNVQFKNLRPKFEYEHYLSESKAVYLSSDAVIDNGRVYSAGELQTTITNIDLDIIEQCYEFDECNIGNGYYFYKDYLPKSFIKSIIHLYKQKTELKGVDDKRVEYLVSKGMLNSMYGMTVTNILHDENKYKDGEFITKKPDAFKAIDSYNKQRDRFLYYPWGVFVTAYARRNLWIGIINTGEDYCYSDTDSIKIQHGEKYESFIKKYNSMIDAKVRKVCDKYNLDINDFRPKTIKGVSKPIGYWDNEGTYEQFKTLGAKRYLTYQYGDYHLTCAGLSKSKGIEYLKSQGNPFELFNDELFIPAEHTGKLTHTYIDYPMVKTVTDFQGNSCIVESKSGVHLEPTEFTLSISIQYAQFLKHLIKGEIFISEKETLA